MACGLQNAMATTYSGAVVRTSHLSGCSPTWASDLGMPWRGMPLQPRRLMLSGLIIAASLAGGLAGALLFVAHRLRRALRACGADRVYRNGLRGLSPPAGRRSSFRGPDGEACSTRRYRPRLAAKTRASSDSKPGIGRRVPNTSPCVPPSSAAAEGFSGRTIGAQQHRRLQGQRQVFDPASDVPSRANFRHCAASQQRAQLPCMGIEIGIGGPVRIDFGQQRRPGVRLAGKRTQHVQALDVAAALPDRIQRRLPVQPREHRFFDIAGAAEALLRFVDERRRTLADPVLCRWPWAMRANAASPGSRGARSTAPATRIANCVAASDAMARSASTLRINACSTRRLPNARRCDAWCTAWASAMPFPPRSEHQSRRVSLTNLEDSAIPRPSSPMRCGPGTFELRPRRRRWTNRRACPSSAAPQRVAAAVGRPARSRKQVRAARRLRPSTRNASDIGADRNHLWPTSCIRLGIKRVARVVFARTSLPPCFSVCHADGDARACPAWQVTRIVGGAIALSAHSFQRQHLPQQPAPRRGHRQRAATAGSTW